MMFDSCWTKYSKQIVDLEGNPEKAAELAKKLGSQFELNFKNIANELPELSNAELVQAAIARMQEQRALDLSVKRLRVIKNAEAQARMQAVSAGDSQKLQAMVTQDVAGKYNIESMESVSNGIYASYSPDIQTIAKAFGNKILGMYQNYDTAVQFMEALYGNAEYTSKAGERLKVSSEMKRAADTWVKLAETIRTRSEKAGAYIRDNPLWRIPQKWNVDKVLRMGEEKFVEHFFDAADRDAYNTKLNKVVSDEDLRTYLIQAYRTISTDGATKALDDFYKKGGETVDMLGGSRALFIKDAESWMRLNDMYGDGGILSIIDQHARRNANVLAVVERFGPAALKNMDFMLAKIEQENATAGKNVDKDKNIASQIKADLSKKLGLGDDIANSKAANTIRMLTSLSGLRLGSAWILSLTGDNATIQRQNALWGISDASFYMIRAKRLFESSGDRFAMESAGLAAHAYSDALYTGSRDFLSRNAAQGISSLQMKLSGLPMLDQANRETFRLMLSHAITSMTGKYKTLESVDGIQGKMLRAYGMTEADWSIYQMAEKSDLYGVAQSITKNTIEAIPEKAIAERFGVTTAQAIDMRAKATERLLGLVYMEDKIAVTAPTLRTEGQIASATGERGTVKGELMHAFFQFKSFPIAMMENNWARSKATNSRLYYGAVLATSLTIYGAMALQAQQILSGKTQRKAFDEDWVPDGSFWGAAFLKGGALGIYGDVLFSTPGFGRGMLEAMAGPVINDFISLTEATVRAGRDAANEQEIGEPALSLASKITRVARGYTPGANIWYTRALFDHYLFLQLQEMTSPGYQDRMRQRMEKDYGQKMWWQPNEAPQPEMILEGR